MSTTWQACREYRQPCSTEIWGTTDGWPKKYGVGLVFPTANAYGSLSFFLGSDSDEDNYHFYIALGGGDWKEVGSYPK